MPNNNPFKRENIQKETIVNFKKGLVACKTLEEANAYIANFSNANNIPVKADNDKDTLKNIFLLCADVENMTATSFISYAKKMIVAPGANEETIKETINNVNSVITELWSFKYEAGKGNVKPELLQSMRDIKALLDAGLKEDIANPTYVKNEAAIIEAYDKYVERISWYDEIKDELDAMPYGVEFDGRDFMPMMQLLTRDNLNATKEEFQNKCREIKQIFQSGNKEEINKIYDQVYDFKDNFEFTTTDYSNTQNSYNLIASLCMNQAFGTLLDKYPEYKNDRYLSSIEKVEKWDKAQGMDGSAANQIAEELLAYGIAIDDINGESSLPFCHYGVRYRAKGPTSKENKDFIKSMIDYQGQIKDVSEGKKSAATIPLTKTFIDFANFINEPEYNNDFVSYTNYLIENAFCASATNAGHQLTRIDISVFSESFFIDGKNVKDAYAEYIQANPDKKEKLEKITSIDDRMRAFAFIALAQGKAVDFAHTTYVNGEYNIDMIPLEVSNPNNLVKDINRDVDYDKASRENAANREERLIREKASILGKIKENHFKKDVAKAIDNYAHICDPVEKARYNTFNTIGAGYKKNIVFPDVVDAEINSEKYNEIVNGTMQNYINLYKGNSELREAEHRKNSIQKLDELIKQVEKANVATYSASKHPEFAAVGESMKKLKEAYSYEKPVTEEYLDLNKRDELEEYYGRLAKAAADVKIAAKKYLDTKNGFRRSEVSERAKNRYDAVNACLDFVEMNNSIHYSHAINFSALMSAADKKEKNITVKLDNKEKKAYYDVIDSAAKKLVAAKTGTNSDEYENIIKAVDKASDYNVILKSTLTTSDRFTIAGYKKHLDDILKTTTDYMKHKAADGIKKNAYEKLDAVIELYEATKQKYEELNKKFGKGHEADLDMARDNININMVNLEEKVEGNKNLDPMAKRCLYLAKNAPNKKTRDEFINTGIKVGENLSEKVKKDAEKTLLKGKIK